jgi:hypothetical protein
MLVVMMITIQYDTIYFEWCKEEVEEEQKKKEEEELNNEGKKTAQRVVRCRTRLAQL